MTAKTEPATKSFSGTPLVELLLIIGICSDYYSSLPSSSKPYNAIILDILGDNFEKVYTAICVGAARRRHRPNFLLL
ncbi:hypothetical protein [Nostoc sp.]|uniref:hypothetical protein n=1 Tax=Nostoc sp. TaxID=1180 RepID=UPI002FF9E5F6